jgi:hypothetical protein
MIKKIVFEFVVDTNKNGINLKISEGHSDFSPIEIIGVLNYMQQTIYNYQFNNHKTVDSVSEQTNNGKH